MIPDDFSVARSAAARHCPCGCLVPHAVQRVSLKQLKARAKFWRAMRYWWVNQNQTYRHEIAGGYLWSPKRKANEHRNPFYESMREVAPGDIIFSFFDTRIAAIGVTRSYCYESPKPRNSVRPEDLGCHRLEDRSKFPPAYPSHPSRGSR
jgi:hypothetical protein